MQKTISKLASELFLAANPREKPQKKEPYISVNEAISSIAFLYEKIRNTIDYKEEHLFRVVAIERVIKRKFNISSQKAFGKSLICELIRSRYLKNNSIPVSKISSVNKIIEKYKTLKKLNNFKDKVNLENWLISIAASEIERVLAPDRIGSALKVSFYHLINPSISFKKASKTHKRIQVFIASQKALVKPTIGSLRYDLLLGYFPAWPNAEEKDLEKIARNLEETYSKIENELSFSKAEKLANYCRKYTAPFIILRELLIKQRDNIFSLAEDEKKLEEEIEEICFDKYSKISSKLAKTATRSIIYIFITKMILALFLEIPFDILISGELNYLPIVINTLFPPFLMFAFVLSIPKPNYKDTEIIIKQIKEIIYSGSLSAKKITINPEKPKKKLKDILFHGFYILTYLSSFGLIVWGLKSLNFNLFSIAIFMFFITVVSFFAYKISQSAKELLVSERQKSRETLVDLFMVPILKAGSKLSSELSKINVFNFILNFIIEAPLKSFLEIGEEWLDFLKEKKEEIV